MKCVGMTEKLAATWALLCDVSTTALHLIEGTLNENSKIDENVWYISNKPYRITANIAYSWEGFSYTSSKLLEDRCDL